MENIKIDIQLSGMGKLQRLLKKADKLRMELTETLGEIGKLTLPIKVKQPYKRKRKVRINPKIDESTLKIARKAFKGNID